MNSLPNVAAKSVENIKRAALSAVQASMPSGLYFGVVTSINPLNISVEQKMILTEEQLILTNMVRDFEVSATLNGEKQSYIMRFALKVDENVILLRMQGGQKYLVLDRIEIGSHSVDPTSREYYEGEYTIIPKTEAQEFATAQKTMMDNLTVTEIPTSTVTNMAGGSTYYIASSLQE